MKKPFNTSTFLSLIPKQLLLLICLFLFIFPPFIFAEERTKALTLFYSGEEHGQLGLHGCGAEQVGGVAHRQTLIEDLYIKYDAVLNLHIGNLIDATDENAEWVYQIGLTALEAIQIDVLCLGPNELSIPLETIAALHTNHPEVEVVCTNLTTKIGKPYLIRTVGSAEVAVIGLISENHVLELPNGALIPPQIALEQLQTKRIDKFDIVVVVFHATEKEAHTLAEVVPWIDVLIVAGNTEKDPLEIHRPASFTGKTAIVTNASQGAAVGVLEVEPYNVSQEYTFTNRYHDVSEKITPNVDLAHLIEVYETSTTLAETFGTTIQEEPDNAIHITYFHKHGCQKCTRTLKILKDLKSVYPQIVVEQRNAKTESALLEAMGILYKVPKTKRITTPAVFIGDTAFVGEINQQYLKAVIEKYLETGSTSRLTAAEAQLETAESEIVSRFHQFGALTVASAGLLDGINPCAFATLVFFISYMNLVGRGRKEMLIAGGAFTFAVFLTYFLLGLGTLSFMNYLNQFSGIAKCVYLLAATMTFVLSGLSLYDAVKAKQGKTKEIMLQLPHTFKLRIHKVIREQTRSSGVITGAFVIGFVISALELVCTGQVYLPTLTFVVGIDGMRTHAIAYLLLYNLMFIVPLFVVFGCIYYGTTSLQLGGVLQKHLVALKVGIALLLCGLGTWLVLSVL